MNLELIGYRVRDFITIVALVIIVLGILKMLFMYLTTEYRMIKNHDTFKSFHEIRHDLAAYLLLALEMAVAIDIVESIINPTIENLTKLGALIIVRFLIGYLLNREMKELHMDYELENLDQIIKKKHLNKEKDYIQ